MKKKILYFISVMFLFSILLSACEISFQKEETELEETGKVIRLNSRTEPGSLHPALIEGTGESIIIDHVFEGLTKKSPEGIIEEGMAITWNRSADGLLYTFTLREGIKWSNGDPVTAGDFEYAWKFALKPSTASKDAYQLYYLAGGREYNTSRETDAMKLKELEDKVGVKALDAKTLEVRLSQATPYFLEQTALPVYFPISKKVQENNPDWANDNKTHVSNGPFRMIKWNHEENIIVIRNENYYNAENIKLDGIEFVMVDDKNIAWRMYRSGELHVEFDLLPEVLSALVEQDSPELATGNEMAVYFYLFNTTQKPFNNAKIRNALSMAINRSSIINETIRGRQRPAYGIVPPGIPMPSGIDYQGIVGSYFSENIAQANRLLSEGLSEEGLPKLTFTLLYNRGTEHEEIAKAVREMWRKNLGVIVQLEEVEFEEKIEREKALDYEVSRSGWIGYYVDPMSFLDIWESTSYQNGTGWEYPDFDNIIYKARSEIDDNQRFEMMINAETILMEEMPVMPIYYYTLPYVVQPGVTGVVKPVNRDISVIYADIQ